MNDVRASLHSFLRRKRRFVVAREHPGGLVGDNFAVKARSEDAALRAALYDAFKRNVPEWYAWKYEVRRV